MIRCHYCGQPMKNARKKGARSGRQRSLDHLIPLSRGGLDNQQNIVRCCQSCNHTKGNLTLEEYRVVLALRRGLVAGIAYSTPDGAPLQFWGEREH
jgi:5-methylcytosine-specific restriction endonuclease McrA